MLLAQEPSARYLAAEHPALVRQFELLATAPGGVGRLRELIQTMAVRGKLLTQDSNDEPASALLTRIRAHKARMAAAGEVRPGQPVDEISEDEYPFSLPPTWAWARFGDVTINRDGERVPVSSTDRERRAKLYDYYGASGVIDKIDGYLFDKTLLLIGEDGANLLNRSTPIAFLAHGKYWVNNHAHVIDTTDAGLMLYLKLFINAISLEPYVTGTAQPKMNQAKLNSIVVAIPPLAEQARIVARVDELMRLCDALEAQGRLEAEQHARLLGTLLGTLTDSSTPEELAANWQRVADHFDLLLDRPEAVDALEQTILQLAVRGLLVPRGHWTESRLGDVISMLNGYAFKSEWFVPSGVRLVRNVNVSHGSINWHQAACVSAAVSEQFAQFALAKGDVVLSLDRPIISTGLKLAVVEAQDLPCLLLQRVARLSPDSNVLSRDFMLLWLRSDSFMKAIDPGRSNGVPHISTKQVGALTIDLPRLPEQARIVARVTELRLLCADLRQRLAASQTTQSQLAEALVESAAA